jgi:hypothetical protein
MTLLVRLISFALFLAVLCCAGVLLLGLNDLHREREARMAPIRALTKQHRAEAQIALNQYLGVLQSDDRGRFPEVMTGQLLDDRLTLTSSSHIQETHDTTFKDLCVIEYSSERMKIYSEYNVHIERQNADGKRLSPWKVYFRGVLVFVREGAQWKVVADFNFIDWSRRYTDWSYGVPDWEKALIGDGLADADAFYSCART